MCIAEEKNLPSILFVESRMYLHEQKTRGGEFPLHYTYENVSDNVFRKEAGIVSKVYK